MDFSQLVFLPYERYEWHIETEQQDNNSEEENIVLTSEVNTFEYFQNDDDFIIQKAKKIGEYQEANSLEKKWMEAVILEQENFIYDAYSRYFDLRLQHPENMLIKKLFASFLVRQGLSEEAFKQLK